MKWLPVLVLLLTLASVAYAPIHTDRTQVDPVTQAAIPVNPRLDIALSAAASGAALLASFFVMRKLRRREGAILAFLMATNIFLLLIDLFCVLA